MAHVRKQSDHINIMNKFVKFTCQNVHANIADDPLETVHGFVVRILNSDGNV